MKARTYIRRLVIKEAVERFMVAAIQSGKSPDQAELIAADSIARVNDLVDYLMQDGPSWLDPHREECDD